MSQSDAYVCTCGPNEYCVADDCHGATGEARSAASRQLKPRSWMYAVPVGYLVNVCEAAFEFTDAALDTAPIPLSSAQAMRWKELLDALEALQNA